MLKGRRGASEVLGALLIASLVITMSAAWLMLEANRSTRQTISVVDLIRAAGRKQRQLLSLTYYNMPGESGNLELYIYNYGEEVSTLKMVILTRKTSDGSELTSVVFDASDPNSRLSMWDENTGQRLQRPYEILPKHLVKITFNLGPAEEFVVVLLTDEGGIFSWKLS